MLTRVSLFLCVVCAIVLVGCAKSEPNANGGAANANKATTATSPAATTSTTASADKIGVPECDEYIAAYDACLAKIPEVGRAQYKTSIDTLRASWKKLADNPQTRPSLVMACKQAAEQAKTAMKTYNCTF
jgi:hypothetical protein